MDHLQRQPQAPLQAQVAILTAENAALRARLFFMEQGVSMMDRAMRGIALDVSAEALAEGLASDPVGFLDVLEDLAGMPVIQMEGFCEGIEQAVLGQYGEQVIPAFLRRVADVIDARLQQIRAGGLAA